MQFCDRILWRSLPGLQGNLQLRSLYSAPDVMTSDHKPVGAVFGLELPTALAKPKPYGKGVWNVTVRVMGLECENLPAMDSDGSSDPFVKIIGDALVPEGEQ